MSVQQKAPFAQEWGTDHYDSQPSAKHTSRTAIKLWLKCYEDFYQIPFPLHTTARQRWWMLSTLEITQIKDTYKMTDYDVHLLIAWFWGLKAPDCQGHITGLHYARFCIRAFRSWLRSRPQLIASLDSPEQLLKICQAERAGRCEPPAGNQDEVRAQLRALSDERYSGPPSNAPDVAVTGDEYAVF